MMLVPILVVGLVLSPVAPGASMGVTARVLFDMGDGSYRWGDLTMAKPGEYNATWRATLATAQALGVPLEWSWYSSFGVFPRIGGRSAEGYTGIFLWNRTALNWEAASVGISTLNLSQGDALALSATAFDGVSFALRTPIPTPLHPYPSMGFRGDAMNQGHSPSTAPDGINLEWDHDTGVREIGATPAVALGVVFVNTPGGFQALASNDGHLLWSNAGVKGWSSPAVFNGSVFVGARDGRLYRLNATDGREIWNVTLLEHPTFSGIDSSPRVTGDRLYIGTFNESGGPGEVVSLWASNGTVVWRHPTGSIHYSTPAVVDGTVYVGVMGRYNVTTTTTFDPPHGILALDAATGVERWFHPTGGAVAASPLVTGPMVVFPSKDGNLYALNATTGALAWQLPGLGADVSSPAFDGTLIFLAGGGLGGSGRVSAVDTGGQVRWTFVPNGPVQASPTYADRKVLFSTNTAHGMVYALDAATGRADWTFEPKPDEYILGSPVVADGTVFAPSDNGHVYALGPSVLPTGGPPLASPFPTALTLLVVGGGLVAVAAAVVMRRRRGGEDDGI